MHRPLTCVEICAGAGGQALGLACLYLKQPKRPCAAAENQLKFKYWEVTSMRKVLSCEFNPDTACVELCMEDGTLLSIDCTAVENEVANSMYQRSELDWLIYNDPLSYAELILNGDPELYLKAVTKKTPLD